MAVYERSTRIDAPIEDVWQFQVSVDGLVAVTPDWFGLTVESVVGPDGEPTGGELVVGGAVTLSMRPLGLGPRQSWTSRITACQRSADRGFFTDEMDDGPFRRWEHTHRVAAESGGTRLTDRVEYELPLGPAGRLSALAWPGFEAVFAHRHRRTKQQLE